MLNPLTHRELKRRDEMRSTVLPSAVRHLDGVRKRRNALRIAGLRPIRIWVPDTSLPGFVDECRRQSRIVAAADANDRDLDAFMDVALLDADPSQIYTGD